MVVSRARKRRLPGDQRREVILEAAGRLFGEDGYADTTLDRVAAAAKVTKPVLYRHFDSKKALYLALLERHRDDLPSFFQRVPDGLPMDQRVEAMLEIWFAYVEKRGYAWKMLFRDSGGGAEIDDFRRETQARAHDVLAAFLRSQAGPAVPDSQVEPLAEFLRMGGAGLALWSLEHPEVSREDLVSSAKRVLAGLAAG